MGAVASCFTNLLILSEKLSLWITCTVLICCMVTTITIVLGLGIGLGYNYCFNDMMTRHAYVPAHYIYPGSPRWPYKEGYVDPKSKLITIPPNRPPQTTKEALATTIIPKSPVPAEDEDETTVQATATTVQTTIETLPTTVRTSPPHNKDFDGAEPDVIEEAMRHESTENVTDYGNLTSTTNEADVNVTEFEDGTRKRILSDLDIITLLSKLRASGKNYTLQIG